MITLLNLLHALAHCTPLKRLREGKSRYCVLPTIKTLQNIIGMFLNQICEILKNFNISYKYFLVIINYENDVGSIMFDFDVIVMGICG